MAWALLLALLGVESMTFALVPPEPLRSLQVEDDEASTYLAHFGYLPQTGSAGLVEDSQERNHQYRKALADFQAFADLPVTGVLDEATARLMKAPRCGVSDVIRAPDVPSDGGEEEEDGLQRQRRYARQGSRWRVKRLSYRVDGAPPAAATSSSSSKAEAEREVAAALRLWSEASALRFQAAEGGGKAHLRLRFAKRAHGDGRPFDGAGGVLAHAFFPSSGGAVHFDGDEQWALDEADADAGSKKGDMVSFRQAAAHELGHSLGLEHSRVREALMSPFYRPRAPSVLHSDDVKGIQALYGPPASSSNLSHGTKKGPKGSKG